MTRQKKGFGLLGVVNILAKLIANRGYLCIKYLLMPTHLGAISVSGDESCSLLGMGEEKHLHKENICPAFRQYREGREHLLDRFVLNCSAQNNAYTKVEYLEVKYSNPLQQHNRAEIFGSRL